ncbi:putative iS91 transposase [Escherichia coli P0304816.5]|nr:putative iS91 transposase [Escherichia coli P0304816.5]
MARSAKPRKRKPASQRSKLPRYVVKLHEDDFFDEEDAEVLRFDSFDDAVECCADLNIPFFVDEGNKKLVFWFVRVDDEGYPEIARCTEREFATFLPVSAPAVCTVRNAARFTGRTESPRPSDASPFCRYFSAGKPLA